VIDILVVDQGYPSQLNPISHAFVHARCKGYVQAGLQVAVITLCGVQLTKAYSYDGVSVIPVQTVDAGCETARALKPRVIAVHAPNPWQWSGQVVRRLRDDYAVLAWIHGAEALYMGPRGYYTDILHTVVSYPRDFLRLRDQRRLLESLAGVVYVSEWMRDEAEKYTGLNHPVSFVIPNPVDTDLFSPGPANGQLGGVCIRSLGNRTHGVDVAIRAAAQSGLPLTIVGNGRLLQMYELLAKNLSANIIFDSRPRQHSEMPLVFRQYSYFVAPSRTESQGLAMCEAMSCTLPIVAFAVGGIPEFVEDGVDGILVPPGDVTTMASAMKRLAQDSDAARAMGWAAREHMIRTIGIRSIVARDVEAFGQVTGQSFPCSKGTQDGT
jgi:glycosyltransferase involved in cell wall biosynthesis